MGSTFSELEINKQLKNAILDLGFNELTEIQEKALPLISSGKDVVGLSQTGTGKTLAYMMPVLNQLKFSKQVPPRVLILVPTRELVNQVIDNIKQFTKYLSLRVKGVYGGVNIKNQKIDLAEGVDILVATPGRLYDLVISNSVNLKSIQKVIIDEADIMLDLGFNFQLNNIFDLLPEKKQFIMFSATMSYEVEEIVKEFFNQPEFIKIAYSGEPLKNIDQSSYQVKNLNTKVNLLENWFNYDPVFEKVVLFVETKKKADWLHEQLFEKGVSGLGIIHANKSQNYRERIIEEYLNGEIKVLVATDLVARGLDFNDVSHVVNVDVPEYPENYIHRIGRTGRAEKKGNSILLFSDKEKERKEKIEELMKMEIEILKASEVEEVNELTIFEKERVRDKDYNRNQKKVLSDEYGSAYHEKKDKNKKVNLGGSYRREVAAKYKKRKTRGDKIQNLKSKKKKK